MSPLWWAETHLLSWKQKQTSWGPRISPGKCLQVWTWTHSLITIHCYYNIPCPFPFHYRGLECKSRKSRDTWSNRQIWPWSTKWSRAKPNRVLPRECAGHSKHPLPTTQEKTLHMDITRWSTPKSDWLYSLQPKMENLYTASKKKTWSWLWRRSSASYCKSQA